MRIDTVRGPNPTFEPSLRAPVIEANQTSAAPPSPQTAPTLLARLLHGFYSGRVPADLAPLVAGALAAASPWKLWVPLPLAQIGRPFEQLVRAAVPVEAVGAVYTSLKPYRATAFYLGFVDNAHRFATSEHVANRGATEIELRIGGRVVSVPLAPLDPSTASVLGDCAILTARDVPQATHDALASIEPLKFSKRSVEQIIAEDPSTAFFAIGRGVQTAALDKAKTFPKLWSAEAVAMWRAAAGEAAQNLDRRENEQERVGDVLTFTTIPIVAQGKTKIIHDPDGLATGKAPDPFLAALPGWLVDSVAGAYTSVGRSSGSPLIAVSRSGVEVVGLHWTSSVAGDARKPLARCERRPYDAFPDIAEVDTKGTLLLLRRSVFAFASNAQRALAEIARTNPRLGKALSAAGHESHAG